MDQNISFEGGGLKVSEGVISKVITTMFPGGNYLEILILLIAWFLVGLVTLGVFFYFDKKQAMFKSMTLLEKSIFSLFFGFFSFMITIISYVPLVLFNYDPLNLKTGNMLPFMVVAGFVLYACLSIASKRVKGRPFLLKAFRYLSDFAIVFAITFFMVVMFVITKNYLLLLWLIVVVIYIFFRTDKS
jgi:hypothetical protein